ncbi:hypothetical protein DAPPUDRAFT_333119 [Daphnia pulex]|uniref:Uncharacterized protein n=1 Tax=Daphnia pulex TaxID=6669 RepID=E9HRX1_DAPPU|nr:hypothetical protein DAPPUDRAFT_333119 [Daphnia pulex]|eukprot:EFX65521.1 hypothetical protein DAPPUDRAFT_333119 [Daphnia pulex]
MEAVKESHQGNVSIKERVLVKSANPVAILDAENVLVGYVSTDGDIPHHDAGNTTVNESSSHCFHGWSDETEDIDIPHHDTGNTTVNERSSHESDDISDESEDIDIPNHDTDNTTVVEESSHESNEICEKFDEHFVMEVPSRELVLKLTRCDNLNKGRKVIKTTKFLKKRNKKGIKKILEEMSKRLKESQKKLKESNKEILKLKRRLKDKQKLGVEREQLGGSRRTEYVKSLQKKITKMEEEKD